jgi:drug/metabolite transporter (DMT)-like permease
MERAAAPMAFGAALILGGVTILGVTDNFVRFVAEDAGLWQFHLVRSAMALALLLAVGAMLGLRVVPRRPGRVAVRSLCNAGAMLLYFGALPMMPIAQAGAALFSAPIWVLIFSWALFGHRIGPRRLVAVGMGFAGVLVMLRPDPADLDLVTLMPVAAGALYGLGNLLTREWCAEEPVGSLLAGFLLMLAAASVVALGLIAWAEPDPGPARFLLEGWQPMTGAFLGWVAVQAAGALLAVGMIYRGYQSGETSALSVFEYGFLVAASVTAWLLWGEVLDAVSYGGMALIAGAGAVLAWRARRVEAAEREPA